MAEAKEVWVATANQGKLNEFKMLLNRLPIEIHAAGELPVFSAPPENGDSFLANARIKARSIKAMKPGMWVFGEDSGIEVEGLNNLPGIHSARYAGPKASDAENVAKLLKMLSIRQVSNRNAQFKSLIVAFDPTGQEHIFEGELKGKLSIKATGTAGFGYDSVFIPEGETKTLAELGQAFKNKVSHRAVAVGKLAEKIAASL